MRRRESVVPNAIDDINLRTMRSASAVLSYSFDETLQPRERAALDSVANEFRGEAILDLGVGAGRTVKPLLAVSHHYLGIDYSPEMIAVCQQRYPEQKFVLGDARNLSSIATSSIGLVMFSCNGISMVGHEDRLQIIRETHRVLRPGGAFVLTTYNRNCADHAAGFQFPDFELSANPARLLVRTARFVRATAQRAYNWRRHKRHTLRTATYSVINDVWHDYGVMLYYITLENQRRQLEACGFLPDAVAFDHAGQIIAGENNENDFAMVARKSAARSGGHRAA